MLTQELITEALAALKAEDITVLTLPQNSPLCDAMILCTARSSTHARALAESVQQAAKACEQAARLEGFDHPEWILVDCGNYIVHIMLEKTRAYYNLEALWA